MHTGNPSLFIIVYIRSYLSRTTTSLLVISATEHGVDNSSCRFLVLTHHRSEGIIVFILLHIFNNGLHFSFQLILATIPDAIDGKLPSILTEKNIKLLFEIQKKVSITVFFLDMTCNGLWFYFLLFFFLNMVFLIFL